MFNLKLALENQNPSQKSYIGKKIVDGNEPYLPPDDLIDVVNLTLLLGERPLLLKGEPGCGKTRLAEAVATELGMPFFAWYITSTTRAKDGLYLYDAVKRLQDAQLANSTNEKTRTEAIARLETSDRVEESAINGEGIEQGNAYIKYGALGKAFNSDHQAVVLIDEIDKADIDFPNDLLQALDGKDFFIDEIGEFKPIKNRPIIFITSNDEKDLPDAFLRRCLFHYIDFPKSDKLEEIIKVHFPDSGNDLIKIAVENFCKLRSLMEKREINNGKKVTTSELIDWYRVLICNPEGEQDTTEKLRKEKIIFPEILLKRLEDNGLIEEIRKN
jgi:DNA polymerase III delta prime subunit